MRRWWIVAAVLLVAGVAIWWFRREPAPVAKPVLPPSTDVQPQTVATAIPAPASSEGAKFLGFDVLGQGKTTEGRRVAPASFLAEADGMTVLDQENQRIVLGDGTSIPLPSKHADDIARTKDGFAVLDRTDKKEVVLLDRSGRVRERLPLAGPGIDDPKDVSRLIVSGNDVMVERNGGGPLLKLPDRTEIQGIPTRDGTSLVSAGITNEDEGRAWVTLADKEAVHKWTRELRFPSELTAVAFVDSETSGTIWVVLLAGSSPADFLDWAVCLDPQTGKMRAGFTLSVENPPWASFRDFAVQDGTGLVAARRTDQGVTYSTYRCP